MTFKDHFSGHASIYAEARPIYPDALFAWLAGHIPSRELAWDVGCGNGQASIALAEHFSRVVATDPSAAQIANASPHPNIDYRVEPAERCSLANTSVDLITIAQALHWFDLDGFYAEVRRVLKPGGLIVAWTYADCHVTSSIDAIKARLYTEITGPYWPTERAIVEAGYATLPFPFREVAVPPFPMTSRWTIDHFLAYLRSWSGSQRYLKATGTDPVSLVEGDIRAYWRGVPMRELRWDLGVRCGVR
ncbi:MAG: methyltransferase domain-containing protein [Dokdonella sp.]